MARQDHVYMNLDLRLMKVVDNCVSNIFRNGAPKYVNRKDFVIKAIQNQIEKEKENPKLRKLIVSSSSSSSSVGERHSSD